VLVPWALVLLYSDPLITQQYLSVPVLTDQATSIGLRHTLPLHVPAAP